MISRKGKYAIRASLFLARRHGGRPISVDEMASAEGISRKFLETIMQELKKGGVVHSHRGKRGGYTLREIPQELTLGKILRAIDGPLAPVPCVSASAYEPCEDCPSEGDCLIRIAMKEVREAISRVLDLKTLDKLLLQGSRTAQEPMFHI